MIKTLFKEKLLNTGMFNGKKKGYKLLKSDSKHPLYSQPKHKEENN